VSQHAGHPLLGGDHGRGVVSGVTAVKAGDGTRTRDIQLGKVINTSKHTGSPARFEVV
jgi:hypothetical protein